MTLNEAIKHCEDNARKERLSGNENCANEHKQLAQWLKQLRVIVEGK